jgi:putative oxidoreductase
MDMAAVMASKERTIPLWMFRVLRGLLFLAIGATKLTGTWDTVAYFATIGWGQWFRYLTGLLDVTGAALLFVPRWTFYGALILTCTVATATLTPRRIGRAF